jgi:hypothetical protein
MKIGLDELRAQRELVLKHLRWLEAKITALEGGDAKPSGREKDAAGRPPPPPPLEKPGPPRPPAPAAAPVPAHLGLPSSSAADIKRAKLGCLLLFVGACALFLFLLFGLPYLLDSDETPESEEPPVEEALPESPAATSFRP